MADVWALYERLTSFRDRLAGMGHDAWARDLLAAERGGSTSGEVLASVGAVLRQLIDSQDLDGSTLDDEALALEAEVRRLFSG